MAYVRKGSPESCNIELFRRYGFTLSNLDSDCARLHLRWNRPAPSTRTTAVEKMLMKAVRSSWFGSRLVLALLGVAAVVIAVDCDDCCPERACRAVVIVPPPSASRALQTDGDLYKA